MALRQARPFGMGMGVPLSCVRCFLMSLKTPPSPKLDGRILIGPCEIAGYYRHLASGFRTGGHDASLFSYTQHPFSYGGTTVRSTTLACIQYLLGIRRSLHHFPTVGILLLLPVAVLMAVWALIAVVRYDTFIFGFGESLLPWNIDLPLLKLLRKRVISHLGHGSEARPPVIDGPALPGSDRCTVDAMINETRRRRGRLAFHCRHCTCVIGAPFSTTHFAEYPLINSFALGVPVSLDIEELACTHPPKSAGTDIPTGTVVALHAPSNPISKGTGTIITAINRLQARGLPIELQLLTGRPWREVLSAIRQCDFVIDQVYSDTPMAGFAAEAAYFGRPAIVGGYGLDRLKQHIPLEMWPPSRTCHPDEIEMAIEELVTDVAGRKELGVRAQRFIHEQWSAAKVADRYVRLIDGNIPDEWILDPATVTYVEGIGQSVASTKASIRRLVAVHGVEALGMSHRPELEKAFLEFANIAQ